MSPVREEASGEIDWWPFTRLLITAAVLGLSAHYYLGWRPDLRALARLPWNVFEILSFAALISFALAELYLLLFLIPLYAVAVLNDWFYDSSRWLCRVIFRFRPSLVLNLAALCGEILSFGGLGLAVRHVLLRL
jgi:hypothetical protein